MVNIHTSDSTDAFLVTFGGAIVSDFPANRQSGNEEEKL